MCSLLLCRGSHILLGELESRNRINPRTNPYCRWSFGGNRLQLKAETHVLTDVASVLENTSAMGIHIPSPLIGLQQKQDLLQMLIADELTRLMVWLFPVDHAKRHFYSHGPHTRASPEVNHGQKILPDTSSQNL